ncbi:MAG: Gfo/Idh/MocA family oxidoreductase [Pirellula sp.]|nr:Gfo/Idh/MocA family oxidoreductase [Pirellula sp.]
MIAKFHARAIGDMKGERLVACYSRDEAKGREFATSYGAVAYSSLATMLADPQVDIVTICTPSGAHLEPAVAAARAGKHVLVEKPLEVTVARCDKLIEVCEKEGVRLGTIFPSRYHRSALLLKKAIDAGRFGSISLASAYVKWYRTQQYYDSGAWRGTWKLDGGGALMNQAIHSVDLLLWLMGNVRSLSAYTALRAHERIEVEDVATAILEFESGALGSIEATTAAYPGSLKKIDVCGSTGCATLEEEALIKWDFLKEIKADAKVKSEMLGNVTGGGASDPAAIGHKAHQALFEDFRKSIKNGTPNLIDGHQGRRSVELITAIYKSARSGKRIQFG